MSPTCATLTAMRACFVMQTFVFPKLSDLDFGARVHAAGMKVVRANVCGQPAPPKNGMKYA